MSDIDFRGARGSNTGDQFHELWALLQVLDLLQPGTELQAISVEGIRTVSSLQKGDGPTWDGVDCALYYGGRNLESATRVEFAQLKYSAANPVAPWSVARITANTSKKGNNSVIRKLSDDFKSAKSRIKPGASIRIRLVSNEAVSKDLSKVITTRWTGRLDAAGLEQPALDDLKLLKKGSGLSEVELQDFFKVLDFSECGGDSRFATRERVVATVAGLLGDDVSSSVRDLQLRVRELMLPERANEAITEKDILLWFGLSGREGLFPCPPDIKTPEHIVARTAAHDTVTRLMEGQRLVLVHGVGGCGKTTLMHEVNGLLPDGSVTVSFDCYGGGRYIYSDDKRHLPENAFLHLTNDLAIALRLPLFIPRDIKSPATIHSFLRKLTAAGNALAELTTEGILLVVIDAADNAVTAACTANPSERPFVYDLFQANLGDLPLNVRIITSCRTSRRTSLLLPAGVPEIICPPFSLEETKQHLEISFPNPDENLVEQFHTLSNANPRVQAYAIAAAKGDRTELLGALLPNGKTLPDVLRVTFDHALKKYGESQKFQDFVGALAFLPAPIAIPSMASLINSSESAITDLVLDLAPGLRLHDGTVTIADEDFEAFIKDQTTARRDAIIRTIADLFLATYQSAVYSSIHVADFLIASGRGRDLLIVIEQDPKVVAIPDPIVRRQVQLRRLKLSLAACREAGSTPDTLRTVLISAEAEHDDSTLNQLLVKELDLSVEFSGPSLRRMILLDPGRIKNHGSFLAQDAVRAARGGDRVTAREQLYFHDAWLRRRRDENSQVRQQWTLTDQDISARVEAIFELAGPKAAMAQLMAWRPRDISMRVASILVPQLIAAGKAKAIKAILAECPPPKPWDLLLLVPLAMSGEQIKAAEIKKSLKSIKRRFVPDPSLSWQSYGRADWRRTLLDTFIAACELAYILEIENDAILLPVNEILEVLEGKKKQRLFASDADRIGGLFCCWLLKMNISGKDTSVDDFIVYMTSLNPLPQQNVSGKNEVEAARRDNSENENLMKRLRVLFKVFSARMDLLHRVRDGEGIGESQLVLLSDIGSDTYSFDHDHDSTYLREMASRSIMRLMIINQIKASDLVTQATKLATGRYSDSFAANRIRLWTWMRLRAPEADELINLVAKTAESIKHIRAASSDKVEALINLSRLILPTSRDDAGALFNDAINIAKEIDQEAFDQIDFLSVLAEQATTSHHNNRSEVAANIFAFVSGAAERLADRENFPWQSAVHALTCIKNTTALSAISRWADNGTVGLDDTLSEYLRTALQLKCLSPEVARSIACLIGGCDDALRMALLSGVDSGDPKLLGLIEHLSKEALLLLPQHRRLLAGQMVIKKLPSGFSGGEWLERLRKTVSFLEGLTIAHQHSRQKDEISEAPLRDMDSPPKTFHFSDQGKSFITPESIAQVLQSAKTSGLVYDQRDLLKQIRSASQSPRDRIPFLNAVCTVAEASIWGTARLEFISETLTTWKGTPAVDRWCKETLPDVIVAHFEAAARWLKEGHSVLHELLDFTEADEDGRLDILLRGIASVGESLTSRTLFALAEEVARALDKDNAPILLHWYTTRLWNRLSAEDRSSFICNDVPDDITEGIARFLFAQMSDIDTRIRWKAAHCLRSLAQLDCIDVVNHVADQSTRIQEIAYRDPTAPFYDLAAKLWLGIALYRISDEAPDALSCCKDKILHLATSPDLPHVSIREYAKRTLRELTAKGVFTLTEPEQIAVSQVNTAIKGKSGKKRSPGRSFDRSAGAKSRFRYDEMDTIPYWFEDILRIFPTISQERVLELADRWIIDEWNADPDANWWDKEPRKQRHDDRRYGLWSHRHGAMPTIERHGTYLEWHAMNCVVGELLVTHPVSKADFYTTFDSWVERFLPTDPPSWLSDHRGATPLEERFWKDDGRNDNTWIGHVEVDEFLEEVGVHLLSQSDWVVVEGAYTVHFLKKEVEVQIRSGLVSPETSLALVRALQTIDNPHDFWIPSEQDRYSEIDLPPYRLRGWLCAPRSESAFDDKDPFRYDVAPLRTKPGSLVTKHLGLVYRRGSNHCWISENNGEPVFIYETWCDEPDPEGDYYLRRIRSDGWRLWARRSAIAKFIKRVKSELIFEVQIERKLIKEYGRTYERYEQEKTNDKIFCLKRDGSIYDANGCIGTWQSPGE